MREISRPADRDEAAGECQAVEEQAADVVVAGGIATADNIEGNHSTIGGNTGGPVGRCTPQINAESEATTDDVSGAGLLERRRHRVLAAARMACAIAPTRAPANIALVKVSA